MRVGVFSLSPSSIFISSPSPTYSKCVHSYPEARVSSICNITPVRGMEHTYKSRLQHYAQKRNIPRPIYSTETQGPPHALLFKSQATVDGNTFTSPAFSSTVKHAEQEAAKVAFLSLFSRGPQEDDCLYKVLLQELAQKRGLG